MSVKEDCVVMSVRDEVLQVVRGARAASYQLARVSTAQKNAALRLMAEELRGARG